MSAVADLLPDLTDIDEALIIARRAIRKGAEEDAELTDRLLSRAVEKDGVVFFRPFAAAYAWLETHPRWLEKAEGAEWRSLSEVLGGLAEEQRALDGLLGLVIPIYLQMPSTSIPGPVFTSWN